METFTSGQSVADERVGENKLRRSSGSQVTVPNNTSLMAEGFRVPIDAFTFVAIVWRLSSCPGHRRRCPDTTHLVLCAGGMCAPAVVCA